ncbi:class I SAM-dependent methyltransferase [Parahaliea mediterranea]|uniref:class I SAM-dependent methyltransferase n=1 Tax=Parahaliea mediterranea TaxID=651086 RepID=UPI00130028B8|nr:class I SAM-dependent methyltransferase [Parahaliea mediterranea]
MPQPQDPAVTARQLSCPQGALADATAQRMARANAGLIDSALAWLGPQDGERLLEVGPGGAEHLERLRARVANIHYTGLDISPAMVARARGSHAGLVAAGEADFRLGSSHAPPFASDTFDRVLCVNTLYFWARPLDHLQQLRRCLRFGGALCLAYGDAGFMSTLPFTRHGFRLYDAAQGISMLQAAGFAAIDHQVYREAGESNSGETVQKVFHLLRCLAPGPA